VPRRNGTKDVGANIDRVKEDITAGSRDARELALEFGDLLMREADLARAEVIEELDTVRRAAILGAVAALLAALGLVFVPLTLMFVFDTFMPLWSAAFVTTLLLALATIAAGFMAYRLFKQFSPAPKRAIASLQEDVRWLREQMRSSAI
jgi:uncharacterized membrane protein YqjE